LIHPFLELFSGFEKRELFGFDGYFFTGFGVSACVTFVFLHEKAA
jgi:hypothetical protein